METKSVDLSMAELKFADTGRAFSGYASVFGGVDSYGDTIEPGAYVKTLSNRDRPVQMRWSHFGPVIGKWTSIEEDDIGLKVSGELTPGHSQAEDTWSLMKHGAINGLSIGYRIPDGGSEKKDSGRIIRAIDLFEISVVESPADLAATIGDIKTFIESSTSIKEIESLLRDVGGFSKAQAVMLVSRIKALSGGEPTAEECKAAAIAELRHFFQHINSTLRL